MIADEEKQKAKAEALREKHRLYMVELRKNPEYRRKMKDYLRVYTKEYRDRLRNEFFQKKTCAHCGSSENLLLHHDLEPATKAKDSSHLWGWSKSRREVELSKCIVLCRACHVRHHAKLNWEKVRIIRESYVRGRITQKQLASQFGVSEEQIGLIINNRVWRES